MTASHPIYTIEHSNCDVPKIIGLLKTYKVDVLVDVRTLLYSRYAPQFHQKRNGETLTAAGSRYEYLGNFLGGRPKIPLFTKAV